MSDQCPKHDLPTDEHGLCARCREDLDPDKSSAESGSARGWVGLLVAAVVVIGVWATSTGRSPSQAVESVASAAASATEAAAQAALDVAVDPSTATAPSTSASALARDVRAFDLEVQRQLAESEASAAPAPSTEPPPRRPERDLAAVRKRVVVNMYRTTPCDECDVALRWLKERHIRVVEHDVTRSTDARRRLRELNAAGSVPTFDVDGEVVTSFGPTDILRAIDVAARRSADLD